MLTSNQSQALHLRPFSNVESKDLLDWEDIQAGQRSDYTMHEILESSLEIGVGLQSTTFVSIYQCVRFGL